MNEPDISIGILNKKEIQFDLFGNFIESSNNQKLSGRYLAKIDNGKIVVLQNSEEVFSTDELILIPNSIETESFVLHDVIIGKEFHWERKERQRFRGILKIIKEGTGLTAINILPLEEYLVSVISSEMSPNSSIELLKAHAIVSRSWILAQIERAKNFKRDSSINEIVNEDQIIRWYDRNDHTNYDFCADDHCQRYQGITKIINENAVAAVESTHGLVLVYDNKICDARYSKCCGGITESYENVWESVKYHYLAPVYDYKFELEGNDYDLTNEKIAEHWIKSNPHAFCNTTDKRILSQILIDFDQPTTNFFRWQIEYSQDELSDIIKTKSGIDFGYILDLIPLQRGYSSRIIKLKIAGTKKSLIVGKELEIRRMLSKTHLYSSAFVVSKENITDGVPHKFVINGAGWGHGVGLCQIGAAVMGVLGYLFDEILLHYFKGAKIRKIY